MALPNQEVWGAKTSWVTDPVPLTGGYSGTEALKNIRPMMANFSPEQTVEYKSGWLARGRDIAHVFQFGTPIDETICPCGQDPTVSAYGKIDVFHNKQSAEQNKIPDYENVYENENINWFFHSFVTVNQPMRWGTININSTNQQWAPNGENISGGIYNNNNYITPWTYFMNKSILLSIYVMTGTSAETYAMTLDEWKNNHSNEKIRGAILRINLCTAGSDNQDNFAYGDSQYSYGRALGFSLMNAVNNGTSEIVDYATFDYERQGYIPLITRYIRGNGYDTTTRYYMFGYHNLEDVELKTVWYQGADDGYQIYPEIPYSEFNYEQIMKMAACFGVPFTPTNKLVFNKMFYDDDLYIPIIDENGVTHGEYTHGVANLTNPQYQNDSIRDIDYDPTRPPVPVDPNTYSNTTGFNTVTTNAALTKRYVLDAANVEKLGDDLYTICDTLSQGDYENFDGKIKNEFLTQSPIDAIISLQRFPFQIPGLGTKAPIQLGKTTVSAEGYRTFFVFNSITFSGISIFPRFGNSFLDYEPYTTYELYIPFCGTTRIRAADILGKQLNITMQIDLITGSCTAYIMADSLVIETASGSCGIEQPLSGIDSATINSNIMQGLAQRDAISDQRSNVIGSTLYPTGWIKAVLNPFGLSQSFDSLNAQETQNEISLTHIEAPPHKLGAASPMLSWYQEFNARLLIYYPEGTVIDSSVPPNFKKAELEAFGKLKGYATIKPGIVSQFSGFTRGDIKIEGVPATDSERERIRTMFAAGVYL